MKLIIRITYTLSLLLLIKSKAQNMVSNHSFEQYFSCPNSFLVNESFGKIVADWESPTHGTPDYFNKCSKGTAKIPQNWAGICEAKSGNGYIGIYIWNKSNAEIREYIQAKLTKPLEKGKIYKIGLSFCLSTYSKYACDEIGIYFSDKKINQSKSDCVFALPQIMVTSKNTTDNDLKEWQVLSDTFVAEGGEEYITIGNFKTNAESKAVELKSRNIQEEMLRDKAYYYIDDVVLEEIVEDKKFNTLNETFQIGIPFTLNSIFFEFDSFSLRDSSSYFDLKKLSTFMQQNEDLFLEISGHTDLTGTQNYNNRLSHERAKTIAKYLIMYGLDPNKLNVLSFGSAYPIEANNTEVGKQKNRRVEFLIKRK